MSTGPVVRMQALPLLLTGTRAPLWWGMVMLVVIEFVGYATLFTSYLYLRFHTSAWPPPGMPHPSIALGGLATLLLLAGAGAVFWAGIPLREGSAARARPGFFAAAGCALAALALHGVERALAGFRWDGHAYGSLIWTITLVHALHLLVLAVIGVAVGILAGRGFYDAERRLGLDVVSLYWYGVAASWLPLFVAVYLVRG